MSINISDKKFFLLDKDGTLSLGNQVLDGAKSFLGLLKSLNKGFAIATNNSSKTAKMHLKSLDNMGLSFQIENIIVSLDVAIDYIQSNNIKRVFWIANRSVSNYLKNFFVFDDKYPEVILMTFDTELNYEKLLNLTRLLQRDIPYFVTHSDIVCPTEKYDIPDVGTFIKLIKMTTNKSPNISFGKPSQYYIKYIKNKYSLKESDMVIVGDRLYTDIKLAQNSDITSILVLSGETTLKDYNKSPIKADIVIESISDLISFFK